MWSRRIITSILVIFILLFFGAFIFIFWGRPFHAQDWKKRTTPLPGETRELLCSRFDLSSDDPLCDEKRAVYASDFVETILTAFHPDKSYGIESPTSATYSQVNKKIGEFEYDCETVTHQSDGSSNYACYYDLRGDGEFPLSIVYSYPNEIVLRIHATSIYGD